MIPHLQGREKALEPLGWTGRKAEWIALACLHSGGLFTRAQLCFHLRMNRWQALRFVQALVSKGVAAEDSLENQKVCHIFSRRMDDYAVVSSPVHARFYSFQLPSSSRQARRQSAIYLTPIHIPQSRRSRQAFPIRGSKRRACDMKKIDSV